MSGNGEKTEEHERPEFKPEYFWAFVSFMLYNLNGRCVITLDMLRKFDIKKDSPVVYWDDENDAIVMEIRGYVNKKPVIVVPTRKIARKIAKNMIMHNIGN